MPRDDGQSLGEQQTYEGGAQPADSSNRSLGDRPTFGGGVDSSLSDIGGLTGDADLDMEIVDLSRYEVQETLGKGGMGEVLLATDTRLNRKVAIKRMLGDGGCSAPKSISVRCREVKSSGDDERLWPAVNSLIYGELSLAEILDPTG